MAKAGVKRRLPSPTPAQSSAKDSNIVPFSKKIKLKLPSVDKEIEDALNVTSTTHEGGGKAHSSLDDEIARLERELQQESDEDSASDSEDDESSGEIGSTSEDKDLNEGTDDNDDDDDDDVNDDDEDEEEGEKEEGGNEGGKQRMHTRVREHKAREARSASSNGGGECRRPKKTAQTAKAENTESEKALMRKKKQTKAKDASKSGQSAFSKHAAEEKEPLIFESLVDERIEPLPKELLPATNCEVHHHKKKKQNDKFGKSTSGLLFGSSSAPRQTALEEAMKYVKKYEPAQHRPFYCRLCSFQGESLEELLEHRKTEEHKKAEELERKATFCRLCKKQFTSPTQLSEHLKGKWHKERWERFRERNPHLEKQKSECFSFQKLGRCKFGDECRFSHGQRESEGQKANGRNTEEQSANERSDKQSRHRSGNQGRTWTRNSEKQSVRARGSAEVDEGVLTSGTNSRGRVDDERSSTSTYRIKLCFRYKEGSCKFGDRCHFSHSGDS